MSNYGIIEIDLDKVMDIIEHALSLFGSSNEDEAFDYIKSKINIFINPKNEKLFHLKKQIHYQRSTLINNGSSDLANIKLFDLNNFEEMIDTLIEENNETR